MAFASCAQYEHGYFTAYARLAQDHPDLVLHLGDYLYEYKKGSYDVRGGNPRDHDGPETVSLSRLPPAPRAVQGRRRPAGCARDRTVAGGLG